MFCKLKEINGEVKINDFHEHFNRMHNSTYKKLMQNNSGCLLKTKRKSSESTKSSVVNKSTLFRLIFSHLLDLLFAQNLDGESK